MQTMNPTRICGTCKKVVERGDDSNATHGICDPCLLKTSPGGYHLHKVNEINEKLESFDLGQGINDLNAFYFSRRAA